MKTVIIALLALVIGGAGGYFLKGSKTSSEKSTAAPNSDAPVAASDAPVAASDAPMEASDAPMEASDAPMEASDAPMEASDVDLSTVEAKWAYFVAYQGTAQVQGEELGDMSAAIRAGTEDALQEREIRVPESEAIPAIQMVSQKIREREREAMQAAREKNIAEGAAFLEAKAKEEGVIKLDSGLLLEPIVEGDGPKPSIEDRVKVLYHGTLIDGTVFDSAKDRGQPIDFGLGSVIAGWTEGLQQMSEGSTYMLYIPSDLAYGDQQRGEFIGPASTLVFEVQLLEINPE